MENGYQLLNRFELQCDCDAYETCPDSTRCYLLKEGRSNLPKKEFTQISFFTSNFISSDEVVPECKSMKFPEANSVLIQSKVDWLVLLLLALYAILRFVFIYFMVKYLHERQSKRSIIIAMLLVFLMECALNGSCFAILLYDFSYTCVTEGLHFEHELGPLENIIGTL